MGGDNSYQTSSQSHIHLNDIVCSGMIVVCVVEGRYHQMPQMVTRRLKFSNVVLYFSCFSSPVCIWMEYSVVFIDFLVYSRSGVVTNMPQRASRGRTVLIICL